MTSINPYLTFDGNCEEAFEFYRRIFGGEFRFKGYFRDMPAAPGFEVAEEERNRIMHVSLPIGEHTVLMGSDSSNSFGHATVQGNNYSLSVNTDSESEAERLFGELSEGGQVRMPLQKTFWGSYFGQCTDRFGIHWMVNCELAEHKDFEKKHAVE